MIANPVYCQFPARVMSIAEMHEELTLRHQSCTTLTCEKKQYCWKELLKEGHTPGPAYRCMKCQGAG